MLKFFKILAGFAIGANVAAGVISYFEGVSFENWIDFLSKQAEIFTVLGLVLALGTYLYQTKRDNSISAVDQVSLFREKVIPEYDILVKKLKQLDAGYIFHRPAQPFNFDFALPNLEYEQVLISQEALSRKDKVEIGFEIARVNLINTVEDFSLRVIYTETFYHEALVSVKNTFVLLVEENLFGYWRYEMEQGSQYSGTKKLYKKWSSSADRRGLNERLELFDLERRALISRVTSSRVSDMN